MSDTILNIVENIKTEIKDSDYKDILDALMKLKNELDETKKQLKKSEILQISYKHKLYRLVNRYLDISCAYVRTHEERDGVLYDRMIEIDCDNESEHYSIV